MKRLGHVGTGRHFTRAEMNKRFRGLQRGHHYPRSRLGQLTCDIKATLRVSIAGTQPGVFNQRADIPIIDGGECHGQQSRATMGLLAGKPHTNPREGYPFQVAIQRPPS